MPLAPGTLLNNRYRIVSILGQGGMGAVYRASDEHLHIPVALKENLFLTDEYGRQFRREAHILAGLRHTNLPHVTDYFSMENQIQYLVMDYIEGEDLRQRMERMGALPERETVLIGISICDALTYLHSRQPPIVHRDIKPGNIKVTADGQAVLVDFGLAKVMQSGQVTSTGARAMTPGYSPPEQYGTARTDPRSDIYSLGATLYATLTGVIPEDGLARLTNKARLTPIRELSPKVNRRLAETVERALEVDPDDRFQAAENFKKSLIESGELAVYYQERPSISPPPASVPNVASPSGPSPIPDGDLLENEVAKPYTPRPVKRRVKSGWIYAPLAIVLIAGVFALFNLRPELTRSVLAYFSASPTATNTITAVASVQGAMPTAVIPEPTMTGQAIMQVIPSPQELTTTPAPVTQAETTATAALPAPAPSATARSGQNGQIAFASDRSGIMQVWMLDVANPKNQRQLTNHKDGACQPTWAPGGMQIAFISPCRAKQENYPGANIYIMNLDASGNPDRTTVTQVTFSLEGDFDPAWSPDGKRIAFTSLVGNGKTAISVINLDDLTRPPEELSMSIKSDRQPAWSPDGAQIAFVRQFLNSQIWYMTDNGAPQIQLTFDGPVNNNWPVWSRDRQLIFFSQSQAGQASNAPALHYRKYEERSVPSPSYRIPIDPKSEIGPVAKVDPSPDGQWLVFESWPQGTNHDIFMMNVNGSNLTRLTTDPDMDFGPVWRPVQAGGQP